MNQPRKENGQWKKPRGWKTTGIIWYLIIGILSITVQMEAIRYAEAAKEPQIITIEKVKEIEYAWRTVTMYNAGDPYQTDSTPCIGANGDNICTLIAQGQSVCAANFVPFGTVLSINGYGECVVLDRMNKRYPQNVDIAMPADKKPEAIKWGAPMMKVQVIK